MQNKMNVVSALLLEVNMAVASSSVDVHSLSLKIIAVFFSKEGENDLNTSSRFLALNLAEVWVSAMASSC